MEGKQWEWLMDGKKAHFGKGSIWDTWHCNSN